MNGLAITAPAPATVGENMATAISGVSLAENGDAGPITVTLTDTHGVLSATDTGGTVSSPGTTITIEGTLSEVNADLATLKDADGTLGSDTITVNATDNLGHNAAQ